MPENPTNQKENRLHGARDVVSRIRETLQGLVEQPPEFTPQEQIEWQEHLNNFLTSPPELKAVLFPKISSVKDLAFAFSRYVRSERKSKAEQKAIAQKEERACLSFLQKHYPEKTFTIFSSRGSDGIIFFDAKQPEILYKVSRKKTSLEFPRRESAVMKLLNETGLTPHFYEFIEGERTIIVMEKIDCDPSSADHRFDDLPRDQRKQEAQRIISILDGYHLYPRDVEFVIDKRTGRFRILDCGGLTFDPDPNRSISELVQAHLDLDRL